jgi:thermitase
MTAQHGYRALGQWHEINLLPLNATDSSRAPRAMRGRRAITTATGISAARPNADAEAIAHVVKESPVLQSRIGDPSQLAVVQGSVPARRAAAGPGARRRSPISTYGAITLATETVIAEGLRQDDLKAAHAFGASIVEEGLDGKVLLRVKGVDEVFGLVDLLLQREVGSVTPNFLRRVAHTPRSAPAAAWSHGKIGVAKAWDITKGHKDIKVAVLDEGVDTSHPALSPAVVAERDFIGGNGNSAMPSGDDAHGTACAGIVLSRDKTFSGIAPRCSLIAARIAMDDGTGHWVFDDFATADAIDWCWREGAAILSNSWGGGAPSDAISRAFARARTQGRGGLGSLVAIAAGNSETLTDFPGDLPGYVTVGASNPADERKTHTSSDGETWWGSNFGSTMTLLAPGVFIWTTDIVGSAGYEPGDFTKTFNGTSSATPAVAGAAALMMSANPALSASAVRDLLGKTVKKLKGQTTWTQELGWGRLDVAKAVKAAQVAGAATPPPGVKKAAGKKAGAKKTTAKKAGAKKTAPRKGAAKKTAPKKTGVNKAAHKKTGAKKTAPNKR